MHDDILQVRAPALCFYVLRDSQELYLVDGGCIGGRYLLSRALRKRGWDQLPIRGIIVTHEHLDHILNVASLAKDTRAWIAAPRLDTAHDQGSFRYGAPPASVGSLKFSVEGSSPTRLSSRINGWTINQKFPYGTASRLFICRDIPTDTPLSTADV